MKWLKAKFKRGKGFQQVPAEWLEAVANFINELEYVGGRIERTEGLRRCRIVPFQTASATSPYTHSFQVFITGTLSVFVSKGWCGFKSNADVERGGETITITDGGNQTHTLYIRCDLRDGTFTSISAAPSLPQDTQRYTYYPIANATVSSGAITQVVQRQVGDIYESGV